MGIQSVARAGCTGGLLLIIAASASGATPAAAAPRRTVVRPITEAARGTDPGRGERDGALPGTAEPAPSTGAPAPRACAAELRVEADRLWIARRGRRPVSLRRPGAAAPHLDEALAGVCAVTIVSGRSRYADLLTVKEAVSRAGISDIVLGSDAETAALDLPAPPSSRYVRGPRRDHTQVRRAPVIIFGASGLILLAHADDPDSGRVIARPDALDSDAPYHALHQALLEDRVELPEWATVIVFKADRQTSGARVSRALAAARSAGFVDVMFTAP